MMCTYYEPGCCIVGTYEDGTDYHETYYNTYYVDELDTDVISNEDNLIISDVQRDNYSSLITYSEAIEEIKKDHNIKPSRRKEIVLELKDYFQY